MKSDEIRTKLTVCVVTYNQCEYIRKCLESIFSQATSFYFDVVIGDDCSTDGTDMIVQEFACRYPERVLLINHVSNVGAVENYRAVHRAARGEYVAHIDGDDYMLPGKLQVQVDALDSNVSIAAVFHRLSMITQDDQLVGRNWPESAPEEFDTGFLLANHPVVGHSAMMYRRGKLDELISDTYQFIDFRVYFELSLVGNLGFVDKTLGAYRVGVGISSKKKFLDQVNSVMDVAAEKCLDKRMVLKGKASQLLRASLNEFYRRDYSGFRELIERSHEAASLGGVQSIFYLFRKCPFILVGFDSVYKQARRMGLIRDIKMVLK